jgi:cytochrome c-type biogenesis protein CcmH/NrfG
MFADPHLLEPAERKGLVHELRAAVAAHPNSAELRVLLGMALCVDLDVQPAIEELRTAVELAPTSFIAQLKMGELWMRLRVMTKAEAYTRQSGLLAQNRAQAELARRQAAKIREIKQHGIERGGYKGPLTMLGRLRRLLTPKVALAREGPAQVS